MSFGKVTVDLHHDTITMNPENEGFEMGPVHYDGINAFMRTQRKV